MLKKKTLFPEEQGPRYLLEKLKDLIWLRTYR